MHEVRDQAALGATIVSLDFVVPKMRRHITLAYAYSILGKSYRKLSTVGYLSGREPAGPGWVLGGFEFFPLYIFAFEKFKHHKHVLLDYFF